MDIDSGVRVADGIVPQGLRADLQKLTRGPIWAFGWKSVKEHDRYSFWHAHFAGDDNSLDCEQELKSSASAGPVYELWKLLASTELRGQQLVRSYANGHTYGVEGYVHTDSDEAGYLTAIYYAHARWDANWAGETVFYPGDARKGVAVLPQPGRVVVFPGHVPHVARGVSRECPDLRVSVVFKTVPR